MTHLLPTLPCPSCWEVTASALAFTSLRPPPGHRTTCAISLHPEANLSECLCGAMDSDFLCPPPAETTGVTFRGFCCHGRCPLYPETQKAFVPPLVPTPSPSRAHLYCHHRSPNPFPPEQLGAFASSLLGQLDGLLFFPEPAVSKPGHSGYSDSVGVSPLLDTTVGHCTVSALSHVHCREGRCCVPLIPQSEVTGDHFTLCPANLHHLRNLETKKPDYP